MPRAQAVIETAHVMHTYRNMSREQREKDCGFLLILFSGGLCGGITDSLEKLWLYPLCEFKYFSYLSHASMGMPQLDHHGEVRGCQLKDTRGNHLISNLRALPQRGSRLSAL